MSNIQPITIVLVCDSHYLILLAALLRSIEVNHKSNEPIDAYIVEDNISLKDKAKLESSISAKNINIHWIKMKNTIPDGMKLPLDRTLFPLNIFIRLFIPYFIPKHIDRVIYLDVDMIVLEDISKLWYTNIGDKIIGAVPDGWIKYIGNGTIGIENYKELGLSPEAKYFNSGLLLINTKKWLDNSVTEKVISCINSNRKYTAWGDQYGLNVILINNWHELDALWNYFSKGTNLQPFIIHFNNRKPFYKSYNSSAYYKQVFYSYLKQTNWRNSNPVGEPVRYLKKFTNVLQKLPLLLSKYAGFFLAYLN